MSEIAAKLLAFETWPVMEFYTFLGICGSTEESRDFLRTNRLLVEDPGVCKELRNSMDGYWRLDSAHYGVKSKTLGTLHCQIDRFDTAVCRESKTIIFQLVQMLLVVSSTLR